MNDAGERSGPGDDVAEGVSGDGCASDDALSAAPDEERDDSLFQVLKAMAHAPNIEPGRASAPSGASAPGGSEDLCGNELSHFHVIERLGAGGMGVVYKAEDVRLGRAVALKVLSPRQRARGGLSRLVDEARRAAAVAHPNIAAVYEADEVNGIELIAMEYVEGTPLRSRIARGPLPPSEAHRIAVQIARGLECAHAARIVHGDLKPDNVMVTSDGRVKLLDFGLARMLEPDVSAGLDMPRKRSLVVAGTPHYMAPEQTRGERTGPAADVFAFGVVLYEMLTARLPFSTTQRGAARFELLAPIDELAPGTPPALQAVVSRALALAPEERFANGGALRAALESVGRGGLEGEGDLRPLTVMLFAPLGAALGLALVIAAVAVLTRAQAPLAIAPSSGASAASSRAAPSLRRLTANPPDNPILHAALSPDGQTLAYADRTGLSLRAIGSADVRRVAVPDGAQVDGIAWFEHGERLALMTTRKDRDENDLWTIAVDGGASHRISSGSFSGLAVSPDGRAVAFAEYHKLSIVRVNDDGAAIEDPRVLVEKSVGGVMGELSFSPDGGRIAYLDEALTSLDAAAIETVAIDGGAPVAVVRDPRLLQESPAGGLAWLRDGRILYGLAEWLPNESGTNLFAIGVDAKTGAPRGVPRAITSWTGTVAGILSASRDATRVAFIRFDTQADVYVGELEAGGKRMKPPRRLTLTDRNERPSAWSRDGRGVFFFSDRSGSSDILFQELASESAVTIAAASAWETLPQLAPDGESLLYWQFQPAGPGEAVRPELRRKKLPDGDSTLVLTARNAAPPAGAGRPQPWETRLRCPARAPAACVLSEKDGPALAFFELDPARGRGREVFRIEKPTAASFLWDLSPDGKLLAIPQEVAPVRIAPIAEGEASSLSLSLPPGCDPIYPTFTADGTGLFVSAECPDTNHFRVYHLGIDGASQLLWESPPDFLLQTEASPDGKHLAISVKRTDNDVWLVEGL